ncbi:MAG: aspartate aminotransferase family protein [Actinobacteria bacterium HGW-Actinobacteria-7]|jgi:predicted acetylornithine/succinylornithine family transaminase|nr:MAG: aspartate aminotransferase family protein [Actinobacteria bacterium HGW-Actinobacteria-7]
MGTLFDAAHAHDAACIMRTYARKPVMFVRGDGMRLYDDDGAEYLDFVSGIGAVNLGHAHPAVTAAVAEQAAKLVHVSNLYYVEHRAELACDLVRLLGGGMRVFFANSGAEANEGAIKLARKWASTAKPGAYKVVSTLRSFHGRTLATLAANGQPGKSQAFEPLPQGFVHVPLNDIEALESALDETVAAFLVEIVQGEGGVWPARDEYLRAAEALCREHGVLLMIDEVQTGFFRTGPAFAHQAHGLTPDVVTLAKSMANGLPMGALVAREEVAAAFEPGDHGSTFGGGPVVCAAGRATVAALQAENLGARATLAGEYLRKALLELAQRTGAISDVRGVGLMVGCSLASPVAVQVAASLLGRKVVVNHIGADILRFLPPLVCGTAEIDTLLATLEDAFKEVAQ